MYCVRVSLWRVKIFLPQHLREGGSRVTSVYLWQYPKFDERSERLILSSDWRVRMQLRRGHRLHSLAGEAIDPPTLHKFENLR
jgi:hypothetical protein